MEDRVDVTVGICAYNEVQTIEKSIRSVYSQKTDYANVREVIVVSSGSTDGTSEKVRGLMGEYPSLRLIVQEKREGKNSAINCYLDSKTCDTVVMLNADNLFGTEDSLENLVLPFKDPKVGITGGRPVPTNDPKDRVGFAVNLMWLMHHYLALRNPKIGELIAFRDIGTRLRTDLQSDEDIIRMELERKGYLCVYTPGCVVINRGPETEEDFRKQRLRVNIGEVTMKKLYDFDIPTWNRWYLAKAYFKTIPDLGFHPLKTHYVLKMESECRKEAERHVEAGQDSMAVWDPVDSTKKV